ncbi:MMPL family transporter [Cryobacterium sp. MDB1-18-2]|nr:MMPL family transporter [Cryobacterium sp. MDB2-A-1]TFC07222.1 MMPL family transporter [Cryobacterium sp. MDB2-33-2]TFC12200.1 MMPL family transporter [Cryobacterium sp. MDB2-A-2]TFC16274.1 MMPL family transporter [Cryobacterium sp. MDB2-10]TFC34547.1 MMPL family transporter [Cryobacterium sp. MDB1-18-2]TFC46249.1 MMPL family transporter [Cryobacterium sp. MDB1-18-1]
MSQATPPRTPTDHGFFWKLGGWCAERRWAVIITWTLLLVAVTLGSSALNGAYNAAFVLPNSSAQIGADLLKSHTDQTGKAARGTASGDVVFHVSSGTLAAQQSAIQASITSIASLSSVRAVSDPFASMSANGQVAVASITYKDTVTALDTPDASAVDSAVSAVRTAGISVDYGGDLGGAAGPSSATTSSELVGIGVAILILLLAFGSVLATLIPVVSAVIGIFAGIGVLGIASAYFAFPSEAPTIALMMGLGVGIDYALFLSTRFRQLIKDGLDPVAAVATTVGSSGRAVVIAAATVVISLIGLYASGITYIGQLGVSASITVAVAALSAITLVPALLAVAGRRIDVLKVRKNPIAEPVTNAQGWQRYATALSKHPAAYLTAGLGLLVLLALPVLTIQIGNPGVRALSTQTTERRASDAIDAGFGPGYQAQLVVVARAPQGQTDAQLATEATALNETLTSTPGVASVTKFAPTTDKMLLVGKVTPTTSVGDTATANLISRLDATVLPGQMKTFGYAGYVTGGVATSIALQQAVASSLPTIIFTVVIAAILLMLLTFRSPVLALKAGIINLLSIGASYGVLVAVFQWGWGSSFLGVAQPIPIVSYVPMLMFAIIFGLSMDYEVFLLSRIREAWIRGDSNRDSVAHGLSVTGRVITCAAVIMACVFFSFLLTTSITIKMLALGLGISVLIDVTVVRLVIVPCAMYLFGRANWWTPKWLDRILPHLEP